MSEETLDFVLNASDELSGPFAEAAEATSKVERELQKLERTQNKAAREMERAARTEVAAQRQMVRAAQDAAREKTRAENKLHQDRMYVARLRQRYEAQQANEMQRSVAREKRAMADRARGLDKLDRQYRSVTGSMWTATKIAAGFAAVGVIGAGVAVGAVAHTAMEVESLQLAYKSLTGSQQGGEAAFKRARELSEQLGLRFADTSESMRELLAAQFSLDESGDLIKMVADLRTVGVEGEKARRVMNTLTQIRAKGKVQQEELLQLAEAGVSLQLVKKNLMELTGMKDIPALDKLQEAGKITGEQGIEAVKMAVMQKTHESQLGQAGTEFANTTMKGAVGRAGAAWDKLMVNMATESVGAFRVIGTAAERFMVALDDPRIKESMNEAFTILGETVADLLPDSESLGDGMVRIAQGFRSAVTLGGEFMRGGMTGFMQGLGLSMDKLGDTSSMEEQKAVFREFGENVGDAVANIMKLIGALGEVVGFFVELDSLKLNTGALFGSGQDLFSFGDQETMETKRVEAEAKLSEGMRETGSNMMLGLIGGMNYMGPAVTSAMVTQAQAAHQAFRDANQEQSPSRLYMESGRNNMLGVIGGAEAMNDNAQSSMRRLAMGMQMAFTEGSALQVPTLPSDRAGAATSFAGSPIANYISNNASSAASTNYNIDVNAPLSVTGAPGQSVSGSSAASRALDIAAMARRKVA